MNVPVPEPLFNRVDQGFAKRLVAMLCCDPAKGNMPDFANAAGVKRSVHYSGGDTGNWLLLLLDDVCNAVVVVDERSGQSYSGVVYDIGQAVDVNVGSLGLRKSEVLT